MEEGFNRLSLSVLAAAVVILLAGSCSALRNPMTVYCERLGYDYVVEQSGLGVSGFCIMPDGTKCLASDFMRGLCGIKYSYCAIKGYSMKTGSGEAKCVLNDGTEEYVTKLVKEDISLGPYVEEKVPSFCGNGVCDAGEDGKSCYSDCVASTTLVILCGNRVCDAGEDYGSCPADCFKAPSGRPAGGLIVLVLLFLVAALVAYKHMHMRKARR